MYKGSVVCVLTDAVAAVCVRAESDADRVKTLVAMNRLLEQKDSGEGENSHLAVLEKLQSTTLSTQDIIDSKIGVVVSKLRKSRCVVSREWVEEEMALTNFVVALWQQ